MLTEKYHSEHGDQKLVSKSYAYEVDPTVEITHHRSSEKKELVKKSATASITQSSY